MSNLFKPPADNTAPSTGPDFASRWGSAAGGGQGEAPRSFSEAYRRYGGLPGDAGFGGAEQQSQDDFAPPASAKGRLVGLRSTPGRTPYGIAPPADRFVSPASNDPRDFVAPRDNPDVNQEALDILQKRYGYLTAPIRNNNPGGDQQLTSTWWIQR